MELSKAPIEASLFVIGRSQIYILRHSLTHLVALIWYDLRSFGASSSTYDTQVVVHADSITVNDVHLEMSVFDVLPMRRGKLSSDITVFKTR